MLGRKFENENESTRTSTKGKRKSDAENWSTGKANGVRGEGVRPSAGGERDESKIERQYEYAAEEPSRVTRRQG